MNFVSNLAVIVAAVVSIGSLSACGNNVSAPTEIRVDRERQAERVAEYIHARYDQLESMVGSYSRYVQLVNASKPIPEELFQSGEALYQESGGRIYFVVHYFVKSSHGAYLTEQDAEFIKRTLSERSLKLNDHLRSATSSLEEQGVERNFGGVDLLPFFLGAAAARERLAEMYDYDLVSVIRATRTNMLESDSMFSENRAAVWHAMVADSAYPASVLPDWPGYVGYGVGRAAFSSGIRDALAEPEKLHTGTNNPLLYAMSIVLLAAYFPDAIPEFEKAGFSSVFNASYMSDLRSRATAAIHAVEPR